MTNHPCADCAVRDRSLCGSLDDSRLTDLHRIGRRQRLAPGETLALAGSDASACGNVISGALQLCASTVDGREQIVGTLYPADFVGWLYASETPFTVRAICDSEVCTFHRGSFEQLLERHMDLERQLLRQALAALDDTRTQMLTLTRRSAAEKVAGFLLDMAARPETRGRRATRAGPLTFDLPLSRGQMAELLGLTIETVSRQLTRLKIAGTIALPGVRAVTIRDEAALRAVAG
jgi:CRP/FNR family transcriptional regulator